MKNHAGHIAGHRFLRFRLRTVMLLVIVIAFICATPRFYLHATWHWRTCMREAGDCSELAQSAKELERALLSSVEDSTAASINERFEDKLKLLKLKMETQLPTAMSQEEFVGLKTALERDRQSSLARSARENSKHLRAAAVHHQDSEDLLRLERRALKAAWRPWVSLESLQRDADRKILQIAEREGEE